MKSDFWKKALEKLQNTFKGKGKMSMNIWKRNAVVSVIVLFVCVALYLSWSYGRVPEDDVQVFDPGSTPGPTAPAFGTPGPDAATPGPVGGSPYFDEARLSRKEARDAALEIFREAAGNESASQEIRDNAAKGISGLAQNTVDEANIENMLRAKGFAECVVFINQETARVVVAEPEEGMTSNDANIIADIIMSESGVDPANISIVHVPT